VLCGIHYVFSELSKLWRPLRLPQPHKAVEDSARLLCNIDHPKFIVD